MGMCKGLAYVFQHEHVNPGWKFKLKILKIRDSSMDLKTCAESLSKGVRVLSICVIRGVAVDPVLGFCGHHYWYENSFRFVERTKHEFSVYMSYSDQTYSPSLVL